MRKILLAMGLFALSCLSVNAQNVNVSATAGTTSGSYATLKEAFAAINSGTHQGALLLTIVGDCAETGPAILFDGATAPSSFSSLRIVPAGTRLVRGNFSSVLIDLQGADNVTIDGLDNNGNSLTLENQTTVTATGVGTVRFLGGASNNTLTRCAVLGSGTAANNTSATIICGDGANSSNTVSYCRIGASGTNLPAQAVLCSSTGSNSNFKVLQNEIFDFFAVTGSSFGINLLPGATTPTISGNRMYQTGARSNSTFIYFIQFSNSASYATITNNILGFANAEGTGNAVYNSSLSTVFRGIYLVNGVSTGPASVVEGNTVSGITFGTARIGNASPGFVAIDAGTLANSNAPANISNNTIGSLDGSSSIQVTYTGSTNNSTLSPVAGIGYRTGSSAGSISNNRIGSMSVSSLTASARYAVHGIHVSGTGASISVTGNQIGGASEGAGLRNTIPTTGDAVGIYSGALVGTISNNTIRNISGTTSGGFFSAGIYLFTQTQSTVSGNTIRDISNLQGSSPSSAAHGVYVQSLTTSSASTVIQNNLIEALVVGSSGTINGIYLANLAGVVSLKNNRVHLGRRSNGSSVDPATVMGLYCANSAAQMYHNTVLIDGTSSSGISYAAYIGSSVLLRNNILVNTRSSGSTNGAIFGSSANADFNNVLATGNGAVIGTVGAANYYTLGEYQAAGYNVHGISVDPLFSSVAATANLHVNNPALNAGVPSLSVVPADFEGDARSASAPTIGADEITCIVPTISSSILNACSGQTNGGIDLSISGVGPFSISWTGPNGFTAATEDINNLDAGMYTVTVSSGACSASASYTIASLSQASISPQPNQLLCANATTTAITFAAINGVTYNWTNNNSSIGLAASGTGNIPSFQAENNTQVLQRATITVTPASNNGCSFKPMVFNLSVNPFPTMAPIEHQRVCVGTATAPATFTGNVPGGTYAWNHNSADVDLPSAGTGNLPSYIAKNDLPAEVSQIFVIVPMFGPCGGNFKYMIISVTPSVTSIAYARPSFCPTGYATPERNGSAGGTYSATPGGLSINANTGAITLASSTPGTYTVTYTLPFAPGCNGSASTQVTINPQSSVTAAPNQVYCNGMLTAPINFTGTAASYSWTNDNPSIGLAASGTGNIPSFTTVNAGPATQYAYVRVTPQGNGSSVCPGKAMVFRIAVNFCPPITQAGDSGGNGASLRSSFSLGPNPASGFIRLQFYGEPALRNIEVRDGSGRTVIAARSYTSSLATIQTATLLPGIYYAIVFDSKTGAQTTVPFMKL